MTGSCAPWGFIMFLASLGEPKVNVSMSSVATAYTLPCLHSSAQVASASQGASTTGTPSRRNKRLQSSLCSLVTFRLRFPNFSTSAALPASFASAPLAAASSFFSLLHEGQKKGGQGRKGGQSEGHTLPTPLMGPAATHRLASSPAFSSGALPSNT